MASLSLAFDVLAKDRASKTLTTIGTSADKTGGKIQGLGGKFSRLSGTAKTALAGTGVAVAAFGKSSIDAFVGAQEQQAQLSAAFEKFPALAGGNINALRDLNKELAKKTKFDDDATASGQAVLAQFGLTADQIERATPLLQDYAARTGKELPDAAKDFGRAMLGQGRAFKGIGLNLKDTGSAAGNLEQLMAGLNDKVGGFAQKQGKTAAGQAAILSNQFGELEEEVGSKLVPGLLKFARVMTTIFAFLADHKEVIIGVLAGMTVGLAAFAQASIATAIAEGTLATSTVAVAAPFVAAGVAVAALVAGVIYAYKHWDIFRNAVDAVASFITGTLWPALQTVASFITGTLVPAVGSIIGTFVNWGQTLASVASTVIGHIAGIIDWLRTNWPLVLAILTGPIGLAVLAIVKNWDTIKAGATGVKDWIVGRFGEVVAFFTELPGKLSSFAGRLADTISSPFKGAFNAIAELWNATVGKLSFKVPSWVPKFGGKGWDVPDIPTLHSGGIFNSGRGEGLALLKDGEGVFTPPQMAAMGGGGEQLHLHVVQYPGENQIDAGMRALRHHRTIQQAVRVR